MKNNIKHAPTTQYDDYYYIIVRIILIKKN